MSARRDRGKGGGGEPQGPRGGEGSGTPAAGAAPAAPRITLPSSGLAADILRQFGLEPKGGAGAGGPAPAPPAAPAKASPPAAPGGPSAPLVGEDRIFAFADQVGGATAEEAEERAEQLETWVTFRLVDELYALPVSHVESILRVGGITRVPHAPGPVRGITNLRGRVLTVVDLRLRLGLSRSDVDPHSRILVVSARGRLIGLLVDEVQQVTRLARERIEPAPADVVTVDSDYILGVYQGGDAGLLILLDVERVLLLRDSA